MNTKVTIIGYGTMGQAIAKAIKKKDKNIKIVGVERNGNLNSLADSDFVILAMKPQDFDEAAKKLKGKISSKSIVISILVGKKIKTLSSSLGTQKVARMMPNLGLSVGAGIAMWKAHESFSNAEISKVKKFLDLICENIETKNEEMINATTAIAGSGLAYFFLLAGSMMNAAKDLKLDEKTARKLVSQTLIASGLLQGDTPYQELIAKIKSKGGTTEAALNVFQKEGFDRTVGKAIKAANKRATELSK